MNPDYVTTIRVNKDTRAVVKKIAAARGETMNDCIMRLFLLESDRLDKAEDKLIAEAKAKYNN